MKTHRSETHLSHKVRQERSHQVEVFPDHTSCAKHRTAGAQAPSVFQQGHRECLRRETRERNAPPEPSTPHSRTLARANCLEKSWASSDHFPPVSKRTDHQASATMLTKDFKESKLFPPMCLDKGGTIRGGALSPRNPVSPDWADAGHIDSKLGSVEEASFQRRPPGGDRQPGLWKRGRDLDPNVGEHPGSGFLADPRTTALQRRPVVRAPLMSRRLHGGGHEGPVAGNTGRKRRCAEEEQKPRTLKGHDGELRSRRCFPRASTARIRVLHKTVQKIKWLVRVRGDCVLLAKR